MTYRYTNEEGGRGLSRYWTTACLACALKSKCPPGRERRITRWEHEHILDTVQRRLDEHPENAPAPADGGTSLRHDKVAMGATHFQMKTRPLVASEMALHVIAYNLTRVMNIMGIGPLMAAIRA